MRLIIGLAVTCILVMLVRYLSGVLLPFFIACFVAYLLQPLVDFNRRLIHSRGRALASVLTIVDVSVVIALVVYLFLPSVISELDSLGAIIKSVTSGERQLPQFYRTAVDFIARYFDPHNLMKMLDGSRIQSLMSGGASILEESIDIVMDILSFLLTLIYILFILIDYPQIVRGFKLIVPRRFRDRVMGVVYDVEDNMNRYFRGQGLVALCAMVFYCIGFSIVGLPLAVPMGIIVGILYMIPYFQYVTVIPVAVICFICSLGGEITFFSMFGKCIMVYVVSQCVCDYIITPHVMGREMGLNPAIILLSLSVWGSLLGIIGMIIALPVTAILMAYYERYISEPASPDPAPGPDSDNPGPGDAW
ncbi:MAG: AI-2E family transporter [Muribaculaceae bacterium]|nr:AI-2E family transporter [Muribaculaceae bacterium]